MIIIQSMQKSPNGEAFTKDKQYKTSTHVYDVKGAEVPDPSAPREALANYIWNYGSSRIGTTAQLLEERIKEVLAPFVRATCSLYWTSPDYVEFADCRLHVKWDELNAYLMELYSVSLNTETRQQVWELAQKACKVLNELEKLTVENSGTDWFKVHATQAYVNGGRAIIGFVDGRYQPLAEELTNIV